MAKHRWSNPTTSGTVGGYWTYGKSLWQPPKRQNLKAFTQTITDTMLVGATAQTLEDMVALISAEAQRTLTGLVVVEVHEDQALRAVVVTVRETDRKPSGAVSVGNTRWLNNAVKDGLLATGYPMVRRITTGSSTTWVTPGMTTFANGQTFQTPTTIQFGSSYTYPEPPPAPESFWSPTPVYGFRAWSISDGAHWAQRYGEDDIKRGSLVGIVEVWGTATMEATCHATSLSTGAISAGHAPEGHDAPHWGCHCGIYVCDDPNHTSVATASRLLPSYTRYGFDHYAIGVVELTGTVIQHEKGSRGQKGEIKHLWINPTVAVDVEALYPDIPITIVPETPNEYLDPSPFEPEWDKAGKHLTEARLDLVYEMLDKKKKLEEPWLK